MRQFIIHGHEVPTSSDISLENLPEAGRIDLLARCVLSAFCLSHALREDVYVHLVIQDKLTIRFNAGELRNLHPDERSSAALIRAALEAENRAIGAMEANPSPGIYVNNNGFSETLESIAQSGSVLVLHEEGSPVINIELPPSPIFVLSDHQNFPPSDENAIESVSHQKISLGPEVLHADHAIAVVHNWIDTDGFSEY